MTVGIDEAGRGAWAGPLVASAVILAKNIKGLDDSKQLTADVRAILLKKIQTQAVGIGIAWVRAPEIDQRGLTWAQTKAMSMALSQVKHRGLKIIIDGQINYLANIKNTQAIIKADQSEISVKAASIVAKTFRDQYMHQIAKIYPDYGFDKHVGYGTRQHRLALTKFGPLKQIHRLTYKPIKEINR